MTRPEDLAQVAAFLPLRPTLLPAGVADAGLRPAAPLTVTLPGQRTGHGCLQVRAANTGPQVA